MRGRLWVNGAGIRRQWLGLYELEEVRWFESVVPRGGVVYDIGAHSGYYTLLASVLAGKEGKVLAFEPLPGNVERIERHMRLNRLRNVTVETVAVADEPGVARFDFSNNTWVGRLAERGEVEVRVVSVDNVVANGAPAPDVLKIDVEGAEVRVLEGARHTMQEHGPTIMVEAHGPKPAEGCRQILAECGYEVVQITPERRGSISLGATRARPAL
jgi:FkbM family methyltransferase